MSKKDLTLYATEGYAAPPIHTRFKGIEWVVWDAERLDEDGFASIIRQATDLQSAIGGLNDYFDVDTVHR